MRSPPLFLSSYPPGRPAAGPTCHVPASSARDWAGASEPLTALTVSVGPTPGLCFQALLRSTLPRIIVLSPLHPMLAEPWRDFLLSSPKNRALYRTSKSPLSEREHF